MVGVQNRIEIGDDMVGANLNLSRLTHRRITVVFEEVLAVLELIVVRTQQMHPVPGDAAVLLHPLHGFLRWSDLVNGPRDEESDVGSRGVRSCDIRPREALVEAFEIETKAEQTSRRMEGVRTCT